MKFTKHMLKYLDTLINDGPYHGVIVLKNTNKRSKQRDAWSYVTHNFNKFFGTSFETELVRKKYGYEKSKVRKKAVARVEFQKAKSFTEFKRVNNQTGGGAGLLPPDIDPHNPLDENFLPLPFEKELQVIL